MTDNVYTYIKSNVEPFLLDPPDTDFLQGYLAALLNVAEEALGLHLAKVVLVSACSASAALVCARCF
jgi:hypothetical protein